MRRTAFCADHVADPHGESVRVGGLYRAKFYRIIQIMKYVRVSSSGLQDTAVHLAAMS